MFSVRGLSFVVMALVVPVVMTCVGQGETLQTMTPMLLAVQNAPVPFMGSDGRVHLVYELWMTNFSSGEASVEKVDVLGDGVVLQTLDAVAIAGRLQQAGQRKSRATLAEGTQALLFLNVALNPGEAIPRQLTHRVAGRFAAAPPGHQEISENGGGIVVNRVGVARFGPPLRGEGYVAGDSCCDAVRHTRAALPINGRVAVAQRFAVDWEQLDAKHLIYNGPKEKLESYTIYGKPALAVTDATVASVVTGEPEQTPGKFPTEISIEQADGNCVILDLGGNRYALYAHLQSESIYLRRGDKVKRGQVIGLVGNSGNSSAPHLHFHVMDSELSLASNGLPYEIESFQLTGETAGTKEFDSAEEDGTPLQVIPVSPPKLVQDAMPLDQLIVSFGMK